MDVQNEGVLLGVIVNAILVIWNIRKTTIQNTETKKLAELTANLDDRVNRLSVSLNQEILRLNRLNDLTRGVYLSNKKLNRIIRFNSLRIGKNEMSVADYLQELSSEKLATYIVASEGSFVEMFALARVIGDADLDAQIGKMRDTLLDITFEESLEEWNTRVRHFEQSVAAVHARVYELLEKATDTV